MQRTNGLHMHLLSISHLYFYTCNACIEYMPVLYVFYICITIVEITLKAPHMCHFDICNKHAAHMPMWNPCVQSHSYYYVRSIYIYIHGRTLTMTPFTYICGNPVRVMIMIPLTYICENPLRVKMVALLINWWMIGRGLWRLTEHPSLYLLLCL